MVAVDMEPFCLVEREGFRRFVNLLQPRFELPSLRYMSDTAIPSLYTSVRKAIEDQLDQALFISFTTDIWTSEHTSRSFMSLTAHWVSKEFQRKMACLHIKEFASSHTGANIAESLHDMLDEWKLKEKVCTHGMILQDKKNNCFLISVSCHCPRQRRKCNSRIT